MELTLDTFREMRERAVEMHASQPKGKGATISVDAIFAAIVASAGEHKPPTVKAADKAAPEWFRETLEKLKGSKCTVSRFLMMAGRYPVQRSEALDVGRWLREAGFIPTKIGGQLIFDL
jgi:hypothetical protein